MEAVTLVIAALAVYRLAHLVAVEPGPYLFRSEPRGVFARLRKEATDTLDQQGEPANFWGALLSCPWCLSVWFGLVVALWLLFGPSWAAWPLLPLALSGVAGWLYSQEG